MRWGARGRGPASPSSNGSRSFLDNAIRAQGLMDVALAFKSHPLTDRLIPSLFLNLSEKNTGGLLILVWGCRGNCIPCELHCHNISVLFGTLKDTASCSSGPQSTGSCQVVGERVGGECSAKPRIRRTPGFGNVGSHPSEAWGHLVPGKWRGGFREQTFFKRILV